MNTMTTKKVAAAVASLVIAGSAVAGTVYMLGDSDKASTQATTGVVNSAFVAGSKEVKYGEQVIQVPAVDENGDPVTDENGTQIYEDKTVDLTQTYTVYDKASEEAQLLLYGGDTNEYFLGTASLFSVFVEDELWVNGVSDFEGRIAAGYYKSNAESMSVAAKVTLNGAAALICDNAGNAFGGAQSSPLVASTGITSTSRDFADSLVLVDGLIDFDAEFVKLREQSAKLAALEANLGTVTPGATHVTFECNSSGLNVFTFTAEDLAELFGNKQTLDIVIPEGGYVVINIGGDMATYPMGGVSVNGTSLESAENKDNSRVLFNYYEATDSNFIDTCIRGSILAPSADLNLDNAPADGNQHYVGAGHTYGAIYAKNFEATTEQGKFAYTMPQKMYDDYVAQYGETATDKYAAHFIYMDDSVYGTYHEYSDEEVFTPADAYNLGNAFETGDTLTILSGDNLGGSYADTDVVWEVYVDNDKIADATEGNDLLDPSDYADLGLTYVGTVNEGDTYTFDASNVYFVAKQTKYAVHYVYLKENGTGTYAEINSMGSGAHTPATPDTMQYAYLDDAQMTVIDGTEIGGNYANADNVLVWEAYIDNKDISESIYGDALLDMSTYENFVKVEDYKPGDTLTIDGSNVYLVASLRKPVDVDIMFLDDNANENRPETMDITLIDKTNNSTIATVTVDTTASDTSYKEIDWQTKGYITSTNTITAELPALDATGKEIKYDDANSYGITYDVPDGYMEYNNGVYTTVSNEGNGSLATYHVILQEEMFGAHFVYLDNNAGSYKEYSSQSFIPAYPSDLTNALTSGTSITLPSGTDIQSWGPYSTGTVVWKAYEDNKNIVGSKTSSEVLDVSVYEQMDYLGEYKPGDVYEITDSNIYFVAELYTKVNVDITFIDGNSSSRPSSMDVTFKDSSSNISTVTLKTDSSNTTSTTVDGNYTGFTTEDALFSDELDAFDANGNVITYTPANGYSVAYTMPEGYSEFKAVYAETDETTGILTYHITLAKTSSTYFYVNDEKKEYTTWDGGYEDRLVGATTYLPATYDVSVPYGYKTVWFDPVANKVYTPGTQFTYPDYDTNLYLTIVRDTTDTPRVHFNIISFSGKHYIPGNKVAQRMAYDQTTSDFKLIGIDSLEALAADKEGKYFMVSMVLGVDNDAVASTKFTISTESLTSKTYIYEETVSHSADTANLVEKFCAFGIHSSGLSGTSLLGNDSFMKDYDGYRQVRMVLPAEAFENEKLYINAYYYDDNGQEYLHGNYVLNMNSNNFWTLKK